MKARQLSWMVFLGGLAGCPSVSDQFIAPIGRVDIVEEVRNDGGVDAGLTSPFDAGAPDAGGSTIDSGSPPLPCVVVEVLPFTVDGGEIDSVAVGMSGDGTAMAVKFGAYQLGLDDYWRAAVMYIDGGIWISPVMDTEVHGISNTGIVGITGFSSGVTTNEGFRYEFGGGFSVLSDASVPGSNAYGVNDDLTAVGTVSGTAAIWRRDGGPGAIYAPADSGYFHPEFWAINSSGVVIGNHQPITPSGTSSFAFTYIDGVWSNLDCPQGCSATTISEKYAGGARSSFGGAGPTRWWLDGGKADFMSTPRAYFLGRVLAVRDDGLSGGVLASLSAHVPSDGRGALWRDTSLVWLAEPDAGVAELKIVEIDGLASTGGLAAAQCYRGETRVACIVKFVCEF